MFLLLLVLVAIFSLTGGGGRIAECIAMEMSKLNVTIVLCDINEGTVPNVIL